jgi:hypothetical protein
VTSRPARSAPADLTFEFRAQSNGNLQGLCQGDGGGEAWQLSCMNTANRMRSIEVLSWKVPIGRVRRRTSRKRRSMALVVRTVLRCARLG